MVEVEMEGRGGAEKCRGRAGSWSMGWDAPSSSSHDGEEEEEELEEEELPSSSSSLEEPLPPLALAPASGRNLSASAEGPNSCVAGGILTSSSPSSPISSFAVFPLSPTCAFPWPSSPSTRSILLRIPSLDSPSPARSTLISDPSLSPARFLDFRRGFLQVRTSRSVSPPAEEAVVGRDERNVEMWVLSV